MHYQSECEKVDSWVELLKQSNVVKITDVFFRRDQSNERFALAIETQSQIEGNILSLSDVEKASIKEYLLAKINKIDSNILSRLSKFISNDEIPRFVFFVFGSIIAYCLIDLVTLPFSTVLTISFALISSLLFLCFSNSKNRHCHNYLLKLLN